MPPTRLTRVASRAAHGVTPVAAASRSPGAPRGRARVRARESAVAFANPRVSPQRRRLAPTPAVHDARIQQENEAMRQRLRGVKPRALGLANALTPPPASGQALSPSRSHVPRPRRHVTPALNDPKIKQANLELRRRIQEAKAVTKTTAKAVVSPHRRDTPPQPPVPAQVVLPQISTDTTAPSTDSVSSGSMESSVIAVLIDHPQEEHQEEASTPDSHSEIVPVVEMIPRINTLALPSDLQPSTPSTAPELLLSDVDFSRNPLGQGGFGTVFLATVDQCIGSFSNIWGQEEIVNTDPFHPTLMAIKEMPLSRDVTSNNNTMNPTVAEKSSLLAIGPHPMIIKLYAAFDDEEDDTSYLLMEYSSFGDLNNLRIQQPGYVLQEGDLRGLAACILLGLQHIHSAGFVHRDLKPGNIVLGSDGRPKIIDFGLAKKLGPGERATDYCGTVPYMAPEILITNSNLATRDLKDCCLSRGYDRAADLWAFGILLYEMLLGKNPFRVHDEDRDRARRTTIRKIVYYGLGLDELEFPPHVSQDARDFIQRLLARDPDSRIGMTNDDEVRSHPWFNGVDWDDLLADEEPAMTQEEQLKAETQAQNMSGEFTSEFSSLYSYII